MKNINNKPLAVQECFPILSNKEILVEVHTIDSSYGGVTLRGNPGNNSGIYCEPSKALLKRILSNPASVKVDTIYWMKGELTNVSLGYGEYYTLKNCEIREWIPSK
jgi:hypothetical protein